MVLLVSIKGAKICLYCSKEFIIKRLTQKYCSPQHQKAAWKRKNQDKVNAWQRKRWKELHPETELAKKCQFCKEEYITDTKHKYQKYCNYNCRNKHHRKNHPEWRKNYRKNNKEKIRKSDNKYKAKIRFGATSKTLNKEIVIKRDKDTCQVCGKPHQVIHHIRYSGKLEDLVCLCRACHAKIHQKFNKEPYWKNNL